MRVSVIIPCYNGSGHIVRCLNSVFKQSYKDFEVIVVDDGSLDDTVKLIRSLKVPNGLAFTLIEQVNGGAPKARNAGLAVAKGDYLQFLDADDELLPEKLSAQINIAQMNRMPDLIAGSYKVISPAGDFVRDVIQSGGVRDQWMDVSEHKMGITSALLWKKEAVVAAGAWDVTLGSSQEYELMFRIMKNGATIAYDPIVNTVVHKRNDSISNTNHAKNWIRFIELRANIRDHVRSIDEQRDLTPFHQMIFDYIRILYRYDPVASVRMHNELLPPSFSPKVSPTSRSGYILLHQIFGFQGSEWIRKHLLRIFRK